MPFFMGRQNTPPDTGSPHPTRRSPATAAARKPAHQPAPDRLSATPTQQDSPRSAHTGRTVLDPSSRHPTIRVISCSGEGHDFSRAIKTRKKIQRPQTVERRSEPPKLQPRRGDRQYPRTKVLGRPRKKIQAPQTRQTRQEADRPLTHLPTPPPPCESSPNPCHPERSRGTLRVAIG